MRKIGIATPFLVPNYGTKLQAYAISTYFKDILGEDAEIINYTPSSDKRVKTILRKVFSIERNISRINRMKGNKKIQKVVDSEKQIKRKKSINEFNIMFPLSDKVSGWHKLKKSAEHYDCVICGSDQIWVPGNLKDNYYTLEFCSKGTLKGSYAASLGVEQLTESQKKGFSKFLKKLDFISIRESIGKEILSPLSEKKEITWVCDPTLLLPSSHWSKLEKKPSILNDIDSDYVFCYFLGTNEEHRRSVYEYAKKNKCKILTVANFKGYCELDTTLSDVQLYELTVNEFLYLIHHSHYVFTDSMHATIFSIIFEKEFATFERFNSTDINSRNSRIYSLLSAMGLENRLIYSNIPSEIIDYNSVKSKKKLYVDISEKFIREEILKCI